MEDEGLFKSFGSLSIYIPNLLHELLPIENLVPEPLANDHSYSTNSHKSKAPILCTTCGIFITKRSYDKHCESHPKFSCTLCDEMFRTEEHLQNHQQLHQPNKYPCNDCNLSFCTLFDLASHSRKHFALGFKCPQCPYVTPKRTTIRQHVRRHENDYKFKCELCDRGFVCKSLYEEHVEAHAGIKKFECDICAKKFLFKRYLDVHRKLNHKRILEGVEEIYKCDICERTFTFKKSLERHLSGIHDVGQKREVPCGVCGKVIANPYNLKLHMRTHTGEKPYVCETCGKAFSKSIYLKRHHGRHAMERMGKDSELIEVVRDDS